MSRQLPIEYVEDGSIVFRLPGREPVTWPAPTFKVYRLAVNLQQRQVRDQNDLRTKIRDNTATEEEQIQFREEAWQNVIDWIAEVDAALSNNGTGQLPPSDDWPVFLVDPMLPITIVKHWQRHPLESSTMRATETPPT